MKKLKLTQEQSEAIVKIICQQCNRHSSRERYYKDLYYTPYAGNRAEHGITMSVLSGFRKTTKLPEISISIQKYGRGNKMGQPVLEGENFVLHIYNSGCGFTSKPFREGCKMNQERTSNSKMFACVVFTATNKGMLKSIELRVPDSLGKFIYSEVMYESCLEQLNIA